MAPDFLLHPIFDEAEALTGVPNREVVYPTPQHRIDKAYDPFNRLRTVPVEHLLEHPQERRPLFELRRVVRPQYPAQAAQVAEVEAKEPEALASAKVYDAAFLIIDFDLEFGELLAEAFFHRSHQPVMPLVGVNQDHQIVSVSRIFDISVLAISGHFLDPLQHPIHLIEVKVAEQGRNYALNAKDNFRFERTIVGWRSGDVLDLRRKR